jgi:hypothetical protein
MVRFAATALLVSGCIAAPQFKEATSDAGPDAVGDAVAVDAGADAMVDAQLPFVRVLVTTRDGSGQLVPGVHVLFGGSLVMTNAAGEADSAAGFSGDVAVLATNGTVARAVTFSGVPTGTVLHVGRPLEADGDGLGNGLVTTPIKAPANSLSTITLSSPCGSITNAQLSLTSITLQLKTIPAICPATYDLLYAINDNGGNPTQDGFVSAHAIGQLLDLTATGMFVAPVTTKVTYDVTPNMAQIILLPVRDHLVRLPREAAGFADTTNSVGMVSMPAVRVAPTDELDILANIQRASSSPMQVHVRTAAASPNLIARAQDLPPWISAPVRTGTMVGWTETTVATPAPAMIVSIEAKASTGAQWRFIGPWTGSSFQLPAITGSTNPPSGATLTVTIYRFAETISYAQVVGLIDQIGDDAFDTTSTTARNRFTDFGFDFVAVAFSQ